MKGPVTTLPRPCPACESEKRRTSVTTRRSHQNFSYVRCTACGSLYLPSLPSAHYLHELYQRHEELAPMEDSEKAVDVPPRSAFSRLFRPHLWPHGRGRGRRILDIGCSSGRHLKDFADRGWQVAGVDIDEAAIGRARWAIPGGDFRAGDPADITFDPKSFDVIRLDNTLEHVAFPRAMLSRARKWLQPGGMLIAYVPHGRSASIRLLREHAVNVWPPFHLQLFSRTGLKHVLRSAGFSSATCWGYTPRGILASSLTQWRRGTVRSGAAPRATPVGRVIESAAWPLLALSRMEEELIGIGRG